MQSDWLTNAKREQCVLLALTALAGMPTVAPMETALFCNVTSPHYDQA
jgi:hypothetical protein